MLFNITFRINFPKIFHVYTNTLYMLKYNILKARSKIFNIFTNILTYYENFNENIEFHSITNALILILHEQISYYS